MSDRIAHVCWHAAMHGLHFLVKHLEGRHGSMSQIRHCAACGVDLPAGHKHTTCCRTPFCGTHVERYKHALIENDMKCPLCGHDHS